MTQAKLVVVCDDDEFVYLTVQTYMEKMGFKVISSTTGEECLELVDKNHPAVLFLDINMPGMNGLEVCRKIKADPRTSDTPIIFVSARDVSKGYAEEVEAGGDFFVSKPFQPNDLAADLYFLAEAKFRPDMSTLQRLRVCHPLALERAKKRPKPVEASIHAAVQEDHSEREQFEDVPTMEFKRLKLLVLTLSHRLQSLELMLQQKGIIDHEDLNERIRAATWGAALKEHESELGQMKAHPPPENEES